MLFVNGFRRTTSAPVTIASITNNPERQGRFGLVRYFPSGKSGGIRIIYYWITNEQQIYMLLVYPKGRQDNLNSTQKKVLKNIVSIELQEKQNG